MRPSTWGTPPRWVGVLVTVIVVVRLGTALWGVVSAPTVGPRFLGPDGVTYLGWAAGMVDEGYPWKVALGTASSTLLYVMFLAGLRLIAGPEVWVIRAIQWGLYLGVLLLTNRIVKRACGATVAAVAVALVALDDLHGFVHCVQYEMLHTFLILVAVDLLIQAHEPDEPGRTPLIGLCGLALGLAFLAQPKTLLLPVALVAGTQWSTVGGTWKVRVRRGLVTLAVLGLPMALVGSVWAIRNHAATGRWTLASGLAGYHFYVGNHAGGIGTLTNVPDVNRLVDPTLPESDRDAAFKRLAVTYIVQNPGDVLLRLIPLKLYHLFDLGKVRNIVTTLLMIAGLWIWARSPECSVSRGVLVGLLAYVVAFHAAYYGWGRYRYPALISIHGAAATALVHLCRRWFSSDVPIQVR